MRENLATVFTIYPLIFDRCVASFTFMPLIRASGFMACHAIDCERRTTRAPDLVGFRERDMIRLVEALGSERVKIAHARIPSPSYEAARALCLL